MSFYNMLFGKNPHRDIILAIIGLKEVDVERFRDCGIDKERKEIYIYTRTGGWNRQDYPNELLTSNPYYKFDEDDDFDNTYATYYFKFPEEIEQDILDFLDLRNKGVSAKFINWIMKTLERPESEKDKRHKAYKKQMITIEILQKNFHVSQAFNGHTIIPLSDYGMDRMLSVIEENNGKFIAYWNFLPFKFKIMQNEPKFISDKRKPSIEQDQIRVGIDIIWEIDIDAWERYKAKFKDKYPKSILKMEEKIIEELK